VLYAFESKKTGLLVVSTILTCLIKEEAPIYLCCIALFYLFSNREKKRSLCVLIFSLVYFLVTTSALANSQYFISDSRATNFVFEPGRNPMIQMIETIVLHPAYFFQEMMTGSALVYVVYLILPLAGVIFMHRKFARYILLAPMLILNLAPSWPYQQEIGFQYNFGNIALLFYLAVISISELKRKGPILLSAMICTVILYTSVVGQFDLAQAYAKNPQLYDGIEIALNQIPEDASVTASHVYIPHLSQHRFLYEILHTPPDLPPTEFVAVDLRNEGLRATGEELVSFYGGYEIFYQTPSIAIYHQVAPS
jgi:hypothetical protein